MCDGISGDSTIVTLHETALIFGGTADFVHLFRHMFVKFHREKVTLYIGEH